MVKPAPFNLILLLAALLCAASCSTTRIIPEGESRLVSNKVNVTNSKDYNSHDLQPYIKQKPNTSFIFGWNPFISIYNWSGGEGSGWDRFVEKVGQKPVVLDTEMIESSKENMLNHLTYNGYYNSSVADSVVTSRRKSTVYYNVTLGERYMIDSVCYNIGNLQIRELFLEILAEEAETLVLLDLLDGPQFTLVTDKPLQLLLRVETKRIERD